MLVTDKSVLNRIYCTYVSLDDGKILLIKSSHYFISKKENGIITAAAPPWKNWCSFHVTLNNRLGLCLCVWNVKCCYRVAWQWHCFYIDFDVFLTIQFSISCLFVYVSSSIIAPYEIIVYSVWSRWLWPNHSDLPPKNDVHSLDGFCLFVIYVRMNSEGKIPISNAPIFFFGFMFRVNNLFSTMKWLFWHEFVWKRQMTVDNFYAHLIQQRCRTIN